MPFINTFQNTAYKQTCQLHHRGKNFEISITPGTNTHMELCQEESQDYLEEAVFPINGCTVLIESGICADQVTVKSNLPNQS
jgi:hypothetical protein